MNYHHPTRSSIPVQKQTAKMLVAACVVIVGLVRLYTLAFPGPCLPALVAVVSGLAFGLLGLLWYVVVRKVEESAL